MLPSSTIAYAHEPTLSVDEFIFILERSGLAERRPVNDRLRVSGMLQHATAILTARLDDGQLIGVSRAISDNFYCTYLSDLAVDKAFQRRGIGRELIRQTHAQCGLQTTLILLAAPQAQAYYPHIGMQKHESCWIAPTPLE